MANNAADHDLALQLLQKAVADHPKGKAGVAIHLGYGRAMISRVLSPNDPLSISNALATRVIDRFHVIPACPATGQEQPRSECLRLSTGKAPTHNPQAMRIWKSCQSCPNAPREMKGTK